MTTGAPLMLLERVVRGLHVSAVVSPRAASLRALCVDGVDLVEPTTAQPDPPGMAGAVLVPWPNRVEGAQWEHEGVLRRLPVNEPDLGHANHGLLYRTDFAVEASDEASVRLAAEIPTTDGYPFQIATEVAFDLVDAGIEVGVTLTNSGHEAAPVAVGAHPYVRVGDIGADDLAVTIDADHEWTLDPSHIPRHRSALAAPLRDVPIARLQRHATFERSDAHGQVSHSVRAADGRRVEVWGDEAFRYTQVWVPDALPTDRGVHRAVALEPMTAPPNALRSGLGLRWLEPGERWAVRWGVRLLPRPSARARQELL